MRTRRATPADFDAVREVYDTWAAAQNGPLTRRGPSFPADARTFIDAFTGVTLAIDEAGDVVGFASWQRGQGSGDSSSLEVSDLLALSGDAYRRPVERARVVRQRGRPGAGVHLGSRRRPAGAPVGALDGQGARALHAAGPRRPGRLRGPRLAGGRRRVVHRCRRPRRDDQRGWQLVIDQGKATCTPTTAADAPVLTPGGLALAWAGAQTCANLRMAGHLSDGTPEDEAALDRVFAPRPIHIRDYF